MIILPALVAGVHGMDPADAVALWNTPGGKISGRATLLLAPLLCCLSLVLLGFTIFVKLVVVSYRKLPGRCRAPMCLHA